jgi:SAM-dependent methyltransferase
VRMDRPRVNYDQLAGQYHARYDHSRMNGVESALLTLAARASAKRVLEVGCGTGRWIETVRATGAVAFGVDASLGMLSQARGRLGAEGLVAARANDLPFVRGQFDLIVCVNALHHFDDPHDFVPQASELLRRGGILAIVGIDPRVSRRRYYYEYFHGTLEIDLRRYPSFGEIVDWMSANLRGVELRIVDEYENCFVGAQIFDDPFLKKESNSLLALLTEQQYDMGLREIQAAIARDAEVPFHSDLTFGMVAGVRG